MILKKRIVKESSLFPMIFEKLARLTTPILVYFGNSLKKEATLSSASPFLGTGVFSAAESYFILMMSKAL